MPTQTKVMPIQVSLEMSFPSAYHSPSTVKRNARELVMGTVRESSKEATHSQSAYLGKLPIRGFPCGKGYVPACPTRRKNHMLPVRFITSGTA